MRGCEARRGSRARTPPSWTVRETPWATASRASAELAPDRSRRGARLTLRVQRGWRGPSPPRPRQIPRRSPQEIAGDGFAAMRHRPVLRLTPVGHRHQRAAGLGDGSSLRRADIGAETLGGQRGAQPSLARPQCSTLRRLALPPCSPALAAVGRRVLDCCKRSRLTEPGRPPPPADAPRRSRPCPPRNAPIPSRPRSGLPRSVRGSTGPPRPRSSPTPSAVHRDGERPRRIWHIGSPSASMPSVVGFRPVLPRNTPTRVLDCSSRVTMTAVPTVSRFSTVASRSRRSQLLGNRPSVRSARCCPTCPPCPGGRRQCGGGAPGRVPTATSAKGPERGGGALPGPAHSQWVRQVAVLAPAR